LTGRDAPSQLRLGGDRHGNYLEILDTREVRRVARVRGKLVCEGQRFEIGLGLLNVDLTGGSLLIGRRDERPQRKLCERDRSDERLSWQQGRILDPRQ
jgi:hypothetical protein